MGQPAARKTDSVSHVEAPPSVVLEGSSNVNIGNLPAARKGDKVQHKAATETIAQGEPSVRINGKPAARMADKVACNGLIVSGCMSVHIGNDKDEACLIEAAEQGAMVVQPA